MKTTETIGGRDCTIYTMDGARVLLIQPVDEHWNASLSSEPVKSEQSLLDNEVELIRSHTDAPFNLVAFGIKDWMSELTPWPAPPTFGKQTFGDGAEMTFGYVKNDLIPTLQERWGTMKVVLGGYSLAGLFALWVGYNSNFAPPSGNERIYVRNPVRRLWYCSLLTASKWSRKNWRIASRSRQNNATWSIFMSLSYYAIEAPSLQASSSLPAPSTCPRSFHPIIW